MMKILTKPSNLWWDRFTYNSSLLPKHLRCASHTLNLITAVDILKLIMSSIIYLQFIFEKCTTVWNVLRFPKSNEIIQEYLGVALPRPIVIRWNSLYDALRIVASKQQIYTSKSSSGNFKYIDRKWFQISRRISENLKTPLAVTIDLLQGESFCYYMYGYLLPSLVSLKKS